MIVLRATPYIKVHNLDREIAFYRDVLGFKMGEELKDAQGKTFFVSMRNGEASVMLSNRLVHNHARLMWLYVENCDQVYEEMKDKKVKIHWPPADQSHGNREFMIETPSGEIYVIAHPIN